MRRRPRVIYLPLGNERAGEPERSWVSTESIKSPASFSFSSSSLLIVRSSRSWVVGGKFPTTRRETFAPLGGCPPDPAAGGRTRPLLPSSGPSSERPPTDSARAGAAAGRPWCVDRWPSNGAEGFGGPCDPATLQSSDLARRRPPPSSHFVSLPPSTTPRPRLDVAMMAAG